jgi:hypothetical protein
MSKALPAVFHHCVEVYEHMESKVEVESDGSKVYVGYTTRMFKDLGLAVPLYTSVMNHLKRMDCVRQQFRGGGGTPSRWVLLRAPTQELFEISPGYKKTTMDDIQGQQIRDLQRQINDMKDDFEVRFVQLEEKSA